MNMELYNQLLKQYGDEVTHNQYVSGLSWVKRHLERLCNEFPFLGIGNPIKCTIGGTTRITNVERFVINANSMSGWIGIETGFGGVWYYETQKPTEDELKNYNGDCLIIE